MLELRKEVIEFLEGSMSKDVFELFCDKVKNISNIEDLELYHTWNISKATNNFRSVTEPVLFGNDVERIEIAMSVCGYKMHKEVVDYQIVRDTFEKDNMDHYKILNALVRMDNQYANVYYVCEGVYGFRIVHNIGDNTVNRLKSFGYNDIEKVDNYNYKITVA